MRKEDLEEFKRLAQAATPGPWPRFRMTFSLDGIVHTNEQWDTDTAFIYYARENSLSLVRRVQELEALLAALQEEQRPADELRSQLLEEMETRQRVSLELCAAGRRRSEEPYPIDFKPVLDAFCAERISSGRVRELMLLWHRGAKADELAALLPD